MTIDRAHLRELHARATQGEWQINQHDIGEYFGNVFSFLGDGNTIRTIALILKYAPSFEQEANAQLFVETRNALPELLDALDAAEAEVARLREAMQKISDRTLSMEVHDAIAAALKPKEQP
jgi:hypothetical protein